MTKQELVNRVAEKSGLSKKDAAAAIDAFLESVTEALKSGDSVSFIGFGKFSPQQRAARQGVNPRTGERVSIPSATVPKFSPGSSLKQALGTAARLPGKPEVPLPARKAQAQA